MGTVLYRRCSDADAGSVDTSSIDHILFKPELCSESAMYVHNLYFNSAILTVRPVSSNYMSNGLCQDNCNKSNYVFAVLQGKDCWCSNYAPSDQEDTGKCNSPCPGYPSDTCGNVAQGLYAYFSLGGTPSGTSGGSSPSSRTSSVSTTSRAAVTTTTGPSYTGWPFSRTLSFVVSILTSNVISQSSVGRSSSSSSSLRSSSSTVSETVSSTTSRQSTV